MHTLRIRRRLALTLFLLVPLGIATKFYEGPAAGWVHGHAGGVLYVLFWIVVVTLAVPSLRPWKTASGVLLATCLLEITQLWDPAILQQIRESFVGRTLIGTTFAWWDFPHYGAGAFLGGLFIRKMKQSVEIPSLDTIIHGTEADVETGERRNPIQDGGDLHRPQN